MDQDEFRRRLDEASMRAWELARRLVVEELPSRYLYLLPRYDDPLGSRGPTGTVKYFGGRFLALAELHLIEASRAAELLWVDGRVPTWINIHVEGCDAAVTHLQLQCSAKLVAADDATLPRDVVADRADHIPPFRIRGPGMPAGWRSVERDGRVSLKRSDGAG